MTRMTRLHVTWQALPFLGDTQQMWAATLQVRAVLPVGAVREPRTD
jgi:hypothetical protein